VGARDHQEKGEKMRRTTILVAVVAVLVAMFATAAYAATIYGDNASNELRETASDDQMYGYSGKDVLHAYLYNNDIDKLYGGRNADYVYADDGDPDDLVNGGRGIDFCFGDQGDEFKACDGNVAIYGGP